MNYRHGFHAGNFADVLKHVVLMRILTHLNAKATPYRVVDTHAGAGRYDLGSEEALRTHEWKDGVARIDRSPLAAPVEALLKPWRDAVSGARALYGADAYPGSPWLCRQAMRPDDRLIAAELHEHTHKKLVQAIGRDERCKALAIDGWNVLRGNVPPKERRGLVLIDPPFEKQSEIDDIVAGVTQAWKRWPGGIYAIWYPIKRRAERARLHAGLKASGIPDIVAADFFREPFTPSETLVGSGLVVINPPYTFREEAAQVMAILKQVLGKDGKGSFEMVAISAEQS